MLSMQVYVWSDMYCSSFKGRKRTPANNQQGQRKKAKLESESLNCGVVDADSKNPCKYIYHALIILPKLSLSRAKAPIYTTIILLYISMELYTVDPRLSEPPWAEIWVRISEKFR